MARKQKFLKGNRRRKPRAERRFDWPNVSWPQINWPRVITSIAVAMVLMTGHLAATSLMDRPIESVVINGAFQRVSAMELEEALSGYVQTGFMSADLQAIRTRLTDIPWVANASVRRRWPGFIEVRITEQYPAACWGERGLLNINGELFVDDVTHVPVELPKLHGPKGSEGRVAAMYFRIEERLQQRGLAAVYLRLDGRGAWEFQLNTGIRVRLGARAIQSRVDRFFTALDEILSRQAEFVDYVDMRYSNGFAIGWKDRDPMRAQATEGGEPHV